MSYIRVELTTHDSANRHIYETQDFAQSIVKATVDCCTSGSDAAKNQLKDEAVWVRRVADAEGMGSDITAIVDIYHPASTMSLSGSRLEEGLQELKRRLLKEAWGFAEADVTSETLRIVYHEPKMAI